VKTPRLLPQLFSCGKVNVRAGWIRVDTPSMVPQLFSCGYGGNVVSKNGFLRGFNGAAAF